MVEGRKAIAGSVALETTHRDRARWQELWMVRQARRAATKGHADDARWWSDKAICALWNMN
jgi:hypothetical protein